MATDTTHFTPADSLPCIHCGRQPTVWRDIHGNHMDCLCEEASGLHIWDTLQWAVAAWNRLNSSETPNSSSAKGGK